MKKDFKINMEIYSNDIISQGIEDFKKVTMVTFDAQTLTIFGEDEAEIQEIFNEFFNYIIGLANK